MARILGVDIPRNKIMEIAIQSLYGVGPAIAKEVLGKAKVVKGYNSLLLIIGRKLQF